MAILRVDLKRLDPSAVQLKKSLHMHRILFLIFQCYKRYVSAILYKHFFTCNSSHDFIISFPFIGLLS